MRLSSSLPPAGFTRAEPSPPVRRRVLRTPWLPVAVAALAMGAGFFAVGSWTEPVAPARTVVPDAATPPPPPPPDSAPPQAPAPGPVTTTDRERERAPGGRAVPKRARPRSAAPRPAPRKARPRPPVRRPRHKARKPRTARPATPSWVAAECRRRFPDDPARRAACVAALSGRLGG